MTAPQPSRDDAPEAVGLLPCPFCGGKARTAQRNPAKAPWFVQCDNCDASQHGQLGRDAAISLWNRRALSLPPVHAGTYGEHPNHRAVAHAIESATDMDEAIENVLALFPEALSPPPVHAGEAVPVAWRYRDAWGRWAYVEPLDPTAGPKVITEKQPLFDHPSSGEDVEGLREKVAEAEAVIRDVDSAARQAAAMRDAGYDVTVERTATHIYGITSAFLGGLAALSTRSQS